MPQHTPIFTHTEYSELASTCVLNSSRRSSTSPSFKVAEILSEATALKRAIEEGSNQEGNLLTMYASPMKAQWRTSSTPAVAQTGYDQLHLPRYLKAAQCA